MAGLTAKANRASTGVEWSAAPEMRAKCPQHHSGSAEHPVDAVPQRMAPRAAGFPRSVMGLRGDFPEGYSGCKEFWKRGWHGAPQSLKLLAARCVQAGLTPA